jgi:iron complex transport system permease protein
MKPSGNKLLLFIFLLIFMGGMFFINLVSGSVFIPFRDVLSVLSGAKSAVPDAYWTIVREFRLNQATTALLSGAGLAVAGLLMQTVFRNPLADPSILGISSGASLGVALLLWVTTAAGGQALLHYGFWGSVGISLAASFGAFSVLFIILFVSRRIGSMTSILIIGLMISYIGGALTGLIKYYSNKDDIYTFVLWGMGSFSNVGSSMIPYLIVVVFLALLSAILLIKPLNLLLLGERYAFALGTNVQRNQWFALLIGGFLTAIITAFSGPIAFIGLAVPHLARNLFRTSDHRILMPAVIIIGASLALLCNWIARLPGFDGSLPINAITSLIGAPMVIWIIVSRKNLYRENV